MTNETSEFNPKDISDEISQEYQVSQDEKSLHQEKAPRYSRRTALKILAAAATAAGLEIVGINSEKASAQWKSGEIYPRDRRDEQYERAGVSRPTADGSVNNPLNNPYGEPAPTVTPSATPTIQPQETDIEPVQKKAQRRGFGLRGLFGRE